MTKTLPNWIPDGVRDNLLHCLFFFPVFLVGVFSVIVSESTSESPLIAAPAMIVDLAIEQTNEVSLDCGPLVKPRVLFRYTYNGRTYESDRISTGSEPLMTPAAAERWGERFPVGATTAHVDRRQPSLAVLDPHVEPAPLAALIFLGGLLATFSYACFRLARFLLRPRRSQAIKNSSTVPNAQQLDKVIA